uniref:Uncharacterized protein n=1 Tax=Anguilla anguilla TaxID=7936 RepID=A0A0E9PL02_ANGAN
MKRTFSLSGWITRITPQLLFCICLKASLVLLRFCELAAALGLRGITY